MDDPPPPPDWGALFLRHRDAMYRVARVTLVAAGLADEAEDAVMDAMVSLQQSPPPSVQNAEAFMVSAAKRRAVDRMRAARVQHDGGGLESVDRSAEVTDRPLEAGHLDDEVADAVDRERAGAVAWDKLALLEDRDRRIVWEVAAKERTQADVATEFGISRPRVSQIIAAALQQLRDAMKEEGVEP